MLTIPSHRLRLFRTLMKSLTRCRRRRPAFSLVVTPEPDGIRLHCRWQGFLLSYLLPQRSKTQSFEPFVVPIDTIDDAISTRKFDVSFEPTGSRVGVSWTDRGVSRRLRLPQESPAASQLLPPGPVELITMPASFRDAVANAAAVTSPDSVRYALGCLQLEGDNGRIAATDGVQAYVHEGLPLPWSGEVLVPGSVPLSHRELPGGPVQIGRSTIEAEQSGQRPQSDHVVIRSGPWSFWLPVEIGRFPDIGRIVPSETGPTRVAIDREDRVMLAESIDGLPGSADDPVTLLATGVVHVIAKQADERTQIDLPGSRTLGPHRRVTMRRSFLKRAAELGFDEIELHGGDRPAVCRDSRQGGRTYLWMTLHEEPVEHSGSVRTAPAAA